jgi:hypothetical protein
MGGSSSYRTRDSRMAPVNEASRAAGDGDLVFLPISESMALRMEANKLSMSGSEVTAHFPSSQTQTNQLAKAPAKTLIL